jgi:[acyl-carrier-protein] S-malonyltransferase
MANSVSVPATDELIEELRYFYAENLEIPLDMVTADADLIADLGVDSLTQDELMIQALERYGISFEASDIQPMNYPTIVDLADLVLRLDREGNDEKN